VYLRRRYCAAAFLREKRGGKDLDVKKLSAMDVRSQLAALFDANGPATIGRKLSSVGAFCRFLVKRGVMAGNPAAAIRGPRSTAVCARARRRRRGPSRGDAPKEHRAHHASQARR